MMTSPRIISLVGIDGSGKSTQAQLLVVRLQEAGLPAAYLWNRWEPRAMGHLARAFKRRAREGNAVGATNRDADMSRKRRLMRWPAAAWLWVMMAAAEYALQSRRRLRSSGADLVVSDRYFPDFVIDQAMNLGGTCDDVDRVLRLVPRAWFVPSSIVVVLVADAETCVARKWDGLPVSALEARQELYRRLVDQGLAVAVDASRGVDAVANAVFAALGSSSALDGMERL